jgi:2-haloacid dehalogenase
VLDFRNYAALTFDCYGTLIDWEAGLLPIFERWAESSGLAVRGDDLLTAFANAEAAAELENPATLYPGILRDALRRMARRFNVPRDEAAENTLAHSVAGWPAFRDSAEALRSLQQHYKLAILSNVDRASFAHSNGRLKVNFDLIVTAQDVGSYKPDQRNFETVLARLNEMNISKDRVLHVAQSLYHDHVPAKKLGLATVWINRRHAKAGHGATVDPDVPVVPDAEFPSMSAFAEAVETAFRPAGRR